MIRRALPCVVLLGILIAPRAVLAWGSQMHEIVNRRAAELVPGEAGEVWAPFAVALGNHASDADQRKAFVSGERPRHFIDIDTWDDHPFDDVPRSFEALARKHGREMAERFGVAPWAIEECYRMVVLSLRRGDWSSAGAWAADLGHYVADMHQPLHCTVNYDGQVTGNDGIHIRFEVTMMNRFFQEERIPAPESLPDASAGPVEMCFAWIADAWLGVAPVLAADDRARGEDPDYGDRYYELLWEDTEEIATRQMTVAVHDLAALLSAAWEEAGRPPPPEQVPSFRARTVDELEPRTARSSRTAVGAFLVAGAAIMGAFVLGGS